MLSAYSTMSCLKTTGSIFSTAEQLPFAEVPFQTRLLPAGLAVTVGFRQVATDERKCLCNGFINRQSEHNTVGAVLREAGSSLAAHHVKDD